MDATKLRRISEIETKDPDCRRCAGTGWVCENHINKPWADGPDYDRDMRGCACGAGAPCPSCNALALEAHHATA